MKRKNPTDKIKNKSFKSSKLKINDKNLQNETSVLLINDNAPKNFEQGIIMLFHSLGKMV